MANSAIVELTITRNHDVLEGFGLRCRIILVYLCRLGTIFHALGLHQLVERLRTLHIGEKREHNFASSLKSSSFARILVVICIIQHRGARNANEPHVALVVDILARTAPLRQCAVLHLARNPLLDRLLARLELDGLSLQYLASSLLHLAAPRIDYRNLILVGTILLRN